MLLSHFPEYYTNQRELIMILFETLEWGKRANHFSGLKDRRNYFILCNLKFECAVNFISKTILDKLMLFNILEGDYRV